MAAEDYLPYDYYASDEDQERDLACKFCGATDLEWFHTGKRWRLYGPDGKLHVCSNDHVIDDFEVLA